MEKYYTRVCNFYFGKDSIRNIKKKKSLPLNGNKFISFDEIEIFTRKKIKRIHIKDINLLNKKIKKKVKKDLSIITKKKFFKKLKFTKIPLLMGIVNLTPDSFSDGGMFNKKNQGYIRCKYLVKKGCDLIDIGGESTRPGSKEVKKEIEWNRIKGTLKQIKKSKNFKSIDTRKSWIMYKALKYKIDLINDVSGLNYDIKTTDFLKKTKIPFVINHMKGDAKTMQKKPSYSNVILDIYDFFEEKIKEIRNKGIIHNNIILDPGIGFGKNLKHNITLIKNISIFHSLGFPIMLGYSKKRFIKELAKDNDSKDRLGGTISSSLYAMMQGVQILRVHDVNEVNQSIKIFKSFNY